MVATGKIMATEQEPRIKGMMHHSTLNCPFCCRPMKPPVYKCKDRHQLACADCCRERQCQQCDGGGGFNVRSTWADNFFTDVRAECRHEGCRIYATYYKLDDHQSACPFTPYKCFVPGHGYESPPPALTNHLSTVHLMPMHKIRYGKVLQLQVPVSEPQRLLFAEEEGRMFFVVGGALIMNAPIVVSIICIRAGASPPPYYMTRVWANRPLQAPNGRINAVELEIEVTSSKEPAPSPWRS